MPSPYYRAQVPQDSESGSSNTPTTSQGAKARRHRLPLAASKILEDYIQSPGFRENNPTGMPNKSVREKLLADVKKLPGTEFYKMMNLTNWFRYRQPVGHQKENSEGTRAASAFAPSTSQGQTSNSRYHSLSANAITSLSTLCKDTPNPSQETIALWAKFLHHETPGVTLEDVNRFVHDCHSPVATVAYPTTAELSDIANDVMQVTGSIDSGLPTPGNTASPIIIPSRPMWMTPDPFSVKTRASQSPTLPLPLVRSGSAPSPASAPGSVAGSVSPCVQPRTPSKLLGISSPLMDDTDVERYTPVAARRRIEHPNLPLTQTDVAPLLSPSPSPQAQPRSQSRSPLSPPMMRPVADKTPPTSKSPSVPPRAPSIQLEEDDYMDISASPSPASAIVPLPAVEHAEPSSAAPIVTGPQSGFLQAILQGLASAKDNTAPLVPAVGYPTNKAEFDAAFAQFDSTCLMIGEMLETRRAHEG